MAQPEAFHTCPSTPGPSSSMYANSSPSQVEEISHPEFRPFQALSPTSIAKFLKNYPNAASLTPSKNSHPMTSLKHNEMEWYIQKTRSRQGYLSTEDTEWWRWERKKQKMKARMLEMEYRFVQEQGDDWWDGYDWEFRAKELEMIWQDFGRNRKKWLNCVGCVKGCSWESRETRKEESKRARQFGGLVHVVLLAERLQCVAKEIESRGDENWSWTGWTEERRNRYFRIDEEDEEGDENGYFDAPEKPNFGGANDEHEESEVEHVENLDRGYKGDAPRMPAEVMKDPWNNDDNEDQHETYTEDRDYVDLVDKFEEDLSKPELEDEECEGENCHCWLAILDRIDENSCTGKLCHCLSYSD